MGLPGSSAEGSRRSQKAATKAAAAASSVSARNCRISSGVAKRETGPTSQTDQSGPRRGLVRSIWEREGRAPAPVLAARRKRRIRTGTRLVTAKQVKELLPHRFLVEDAAQGRGHG